MNSSGRSFRKSSIRMRRDMIKPEPQQNTGNSRNDFSYTGFDSDMLDLAEVMVEQAVGYIGIPLGVAGPVLIDGNEVMNELSSLIKNRKS